MLRGLNCKNGKLDLSNIKWIDKTCAKYIQRSKLKSGDILMTYAGTIGEIGFVNCDETYYLAPNVAKISVTNNEISPLFLSYVFRMTNEYINSFSSKVAQASINMKKIRNMEYYIPQKKIKRNFLIYI